MEKPVEGSLGELVMKPFRRRWTGRGMQEQNENSLRSWPALNLISKNVSGVKKLEY
jgi:hypothetical protein